MKNLKKKWFSEIDSAIPSLSNDVLSSPICVDARAIEREEKAKKKRFNRLLIASLSSSVAFILCICVTLFMIFNHPDGPAVNDGAYATVIEINPRAMFVADKNGNVISITALNSDADVILSHSGIVDQLKSQKIDGAMKDFLDYSARLGYISFNLGTAIRITHTCNTDVARSISETIEGYFMQKGTYSVVYAQPVTVEKLTASTDYGECDSVLNLNKKVKDSSRLYSERQVLNRTVEEMQSIYTDTILLGEMKEYIRVMLWRGISSGECIKEIYLLNKQIAQHEDNPIILSEYVSSYWMVISSADKDSFTEEFRSLIDKMEHKLYRFEKIYGKRLDLPSLITAYNLYAAISKENLVDIENLLASFTDDLYVSTLPVIKDFFMASGISVEFAEGVEILPETEEEFFAKTEQYLGGVFDSYCEINKGKYESAREEISSERYSQFIDSIIEEYGSLKEYWEHKQKNIFG